MEKNDKFSFETEPLSMTPRDTGSDASSPQNAAASPMPSSSSAPLLPLSPPSSKTEGKEDHGMASQPLAACSVGDGPACPLSHTLVQELVKALTPRPFRQRHPILFWGGLGLFACLLFLSLFSVLETPNIAKTDRIAVVRVEGAILDTAPLLKWIDKIRKDSSVKGVLLRIDSPGGGAAASQELYDALQHLGQGMPIVASMGSVAASGGLMVAMSASRVLANASTVTGSIGVRMDVPQVQGLLGKLGIGQETLTTGRFKDAGSMTRPLGAEEKAYLKGVLQDMHDQFVLLVAEGRKMPVDKVRNLADGRIFTGREAKELGLVDEIGGQEAALRVLRTMTNVQASTPLYEQPKPGKLWRELAESVLELGLGQTRQHPAFVFQY